MEVLLEDMSRTLKASVTLPAYPPVTESKPVNAMAVTTSYSPPDTPPPSPPLATSPDPQLRKRLETVAEHGFPDTGMLSDVTTNYRSPQRSEALSKDRGIGSEGAPTLKRRSGGISARG